MCLIHECNSNVYFVRRILFSNIPATNTVLEILHEFPRGWFDAKHFIVPRESTEQYSLPSSITSCVSSHAYISALMDRRHFRVNFRIPSLNEYLIYFLRVCNSWQVQLVDFPNISFVIINFQIWVSVLFQPERKRDKYILSKVQLSNSTSFIHTFFFFVSRCTRVSSFQKTETGLSRK